MIIQSGIKAYQSVLQKTTMIFSLGIFPFWSSWGISKFYSYLVCHLFYYVLSFQ